MEPRKYQEREQECQRCGGSFLAVSAKTCEACKVIIAKERQRERDAAKRVARKLANPDGVRRFAVKDRVCTMCGGTHQATARALFCEPCRKKHQTLRRQGKAKVTIVARTCKVCAHAFRGSYQRSYCDQCRAGVNAARKRNYEARKAAALREIEPRKRGQLPDRRPPACRECVYCEPREDFESGMVCRAEAMLRCQPYRPGAQPLVRKEKA